MSLLQLKQLFYKNGEVLEEGDFTLISEKDENLFFCYEDNEDYYTQSINLYDNPYPKIIYHIQNIYKDKEGIITSINANLDKGARAWRPIGSRNSFIPTFNNPPFQTNAKNVSEFKEDYLRFLEIKAKENDTNAMILLAEFLEKSSQNNPEIYKQSTLRAKQLLEEASNLQNAQASYLLALRYICHNSYIFGYLYQDNHTENYKKYILLAANQQSRIAQYSVSWSYLKGDKGFNKDEKQAVDWLKKSAENGYGYAMLNLADRYEKGKGVEKDYDKAIKLFTQVINEYRIPDAMVSIANMYIDGRGFPQDIKEGKAWLIKASNLGFKKAKKQLLKMD